MTLQERLKDAAHRLRSEGNQPWNIGYALISLCEWAAENPKPTQPTDEVTK